MLKLVRKQTLHLQSSQLPSHIGQLRTHLQARISIYFVLAKEGQIFIQWIWIIFVTTCKQ